jgi:hypothetical protein
VAAVQAADIQEETQDQVIPEQLIVEVVEVAATKTMVAPAARV